MVLAAFYAWILVVKAEVSDPPCEQRTGGGCAESREAWNRFVTSEAFSRVSEASFETDGRRQENFCPSGCRKLDHFPCLSTSFCTWGLGTLRSKRSIHSNTLKCVVSRC